MGNPQLQARMQALRSDPEFKDFFAEIQAGGMQVGQSGGVQFSCF